ncbi:hypothetical protein B566_EDAN011124, partial [Ephemera danica]
MRPDVPCSVEYQGARSPTTGEVSNPGTQHVFWNVDSTLNCSQRFTPSPTQSITLTVTSVGPSKEEHCSTECDQEHGCRCNVNLLPLEQTQHLTINTDSGMQLACLCGDIK